MDALFTASRMPTNRVRIIGILGLYAVLWLGAAIKMAPIPDEAYYWTWSQHLAPHYFDHPPTIAWVLALSTFIFGDGVLGLRLFSLLSIFICLQFSVLTVRRLLHYEQSSLRAEADEIVILLLLGSPMFVIGFLPITPDPIQGALTALAAYASIRALEESSQGVWSLLAAFLFVLAVGVKHYAAFIALGAFIGLLFTERGRLRLRTYWPWLGLVLGLVLLGPWLITDMGQESSALWQFRRAVYGRSNRGLIALPIMFGSLMGTIGPITACLMVLSIVKAKSNRILSFGAAALLIACLIAVWAGSGEANWPISALILIAPLMTIQLLRSQRWLTVFRGFAAVSIVLNAIILLHAIVPFLPTHKIHDPTKRGLGFSKLAIVAEQMLPGETPGIIVTERYQIASLFRYHLRDRIAVHELATPRARKSQFDLWPRPLLCPDKTILWVSPGPNVPEWLTPLGLSRESTRRRVERGVQGRKVLNDWYFTVGRVKSTALNLIGECGSGVNSE